MNTEHISSGTIVLGGGYFANFRSLRYYSERVCFVASIVCNAVLAVLLIREKNATMKPYSRVLLINLACDVFYAFVIMALELELEFNEGVYIFVINGVVKEFPPVVHKLSMGVWVLACACACLVSTVEFIFRYFMVVRRHALNWWQLLLIISVILACGAFDGWCLYQAMDSTEDHEATFGHLMSHPMWRGGKEMVYYGADKGNVYLLLFLVNAILQDTTMFALIAFSSFTTMASLRKSAHMMSPKTRYMQSQVNRLMCAEIISLVSVAMLPIAIILPMVFLSVKYVGFGVVIALLLQWIPGVNPITTLLLVRAYRRELFGKSCNCRTRVHHSSQLRSTPQNTGAITQPAHTESRLDLRKPGS